MPVGAVLSERSSGELVTHFASLRVRVDGRGDLRLSVYSLGDIRSKLMIPITMNDKNRFSPTRIVNFVEQRASFELKTTERFEKFRINRIVIFTKQLYTSYPGN
jgi:hypothetical protein